MPVFAGNIVATSQPLAAQAGLEMLRIGGNAVDAAVAAAITLAVVEPTGMGLGGDLFAIVWDGKKLNGINGSGRSPRAWTPDRFRGMEGMPELGWDTVTVPGAVKAWSDLWGRFGRLPFGDLFRSAIRYAQEGFLVTPRVAGTWEDAEKRYRHFPSFGSTFLPGGKAPRTGELFRCPYQADTLIEIAETRGESFYNGKIARKIAAWARETGGTVTEEDLSTHVSQWVQTLSQDFMGHEIHELPPNCQGLSVLIATGILRHLGVGSYPTESPESVHLQVEAMKIAFELSSQYLGEPEAMRIDFQSFLDEDFLAERAKEISIDRVRTDHAQVPYGGGTVYLAAADKDGMMVSLIQSNYFGFGSGIVIPGTGIALQNRGCGFNLREGHPNQVGGGKRPFHTIIPGFAMKDGTPVMAFGVMGAQMQPQGHVQMMVRILCQGMNPQAASDAPRWHLFPDGSIGVEEGFDDSILRGLETRGHRLTHLTPRHVFGGAQIIMVLEDGYCAASDHRKDGQAAGF